MGTADPRAGPAVRLFGRRELRRRWWSLVLLGVLAGAAGAVSLSALVGARQSASAFDRLRDATGASDALIFASQVDIYQPDWGPIAALPYVEAAGSFGIPALEVVEGPPGVDLEDMGAFSVPFGSWRTDVDRPLITEGRAPDPANPHEALVPPGASREGMAVGQRYMVALPSDEQVEQFDLFSEPKGERVEIEVVGIGQSAFEVAIIPGDGGAFFLTPAFHQRYGKQITFVDNLLVRFRPGQGSVAQLESDSRRILQSDRLPVLDARAVGKRVTNGTDLEAAGLALFAAAVALAGAVLVGQALTRAVRAGAAEVPALSAMGLTRGETSLAIALPHVVVVAVAALVALLGAVAISSRFPIGLSRRVDPDVGFHLDAVVIVGGIALMALVLGTAIEASAHRATAPVGRAPRVRRSLLVMRASRAGLPPVVTLGMRLALEPGGDRRTLPTRPAIVGAIIGVMGVVGSMTLLAGMDDAIAEKARFGATWDVEVTPADFEGASSFADAEAVVDGAAGVRAAALVGRALVVFDDVTQPTYSVTPRRGHLDLTVLEGRRPSQPGEVVLGPDTARSYGVEVGGTVTATQHDGARVSLDLVGIALLPTTAHSSYDQGAWVTPQQLEGLAGAAIGAVPPGVDASVTSPPIVPISMASLEDRAGVDDVVATLNATLDPGRPPDQARFVAAPATEPIDISNLRNVRSLPRLFAVFTLLLAMGTVAHVCTSVIRRRGIDLAVLRALGVTPRGTRAAIAWQATTLSVVGVLVGLPLGFVLGRAVWRVVADSMPLVFSPPTALAALFLAVPVSVVVANLLAVWPGRRAASIRPARLLRTE